MTRSVSKLDVEETGDVSTDITVSRTLAGHRKDLAVEVFITLLRASVDGEILIY